MSFISSGSSVEASINTDDSFDDSSINIDETLNGTDVIENSVDDLTLDDDKTDDDSASETSVENHVADSDSDGESIRSLETSNADDPSTSTEAQRDLSNVTDDLSGTEKRSTSSEAHQDSSKFDTSEAQQDSSKFETSDFHHSGALADSSKPFPSSEVLNISDNDSDDVSEVRESRRVYVIESSNESSIEEKADIKPAVKIESAGSFDTAGPSGRVYTHFKSENGVKLESAGASGTERKFNPSQLIYSSDDSSMTDIKPTVKFESVGSFDTAGPSGTLKKLNPSQLVDDVKPIHLGKVLHTPMILCPATFF